MTKKIIWDNVVNGPRPFVVAEAGVNHNGDIALAYKLVDAALEAGADAIKFQTFKAANIITRSAPKAAYQMEATELGETQFDMVKKLELPFQAFVDIQSYCTKVGIEFLSTPFDEESADFLAKINVPIFKVPSGEITNFPYLKRISKYGKPVIMSTGMSNIEEVRSAVDLIRKCGNHQIALLHCTSNYPTDPRDANLRAMQTMKSEFQLPVGYSDHTQGIYIALSAVALGACIIEKHFTLDRNMPGPDHHASLEPAELREMIQGIQTVTDALGSGAKIPAMSEKNTTEVARKSLVAACNISVGTVLKREMVAIKRPGTGLPPFELESVLGCRAVVEILEDTLISWDMIK